MKVFGAGLAAALMLFAAGCGSDETSSSSGSSGSTDSGSNSSGDSAAKEVVKIGIAPDIFYAPMYIAAEKGFYAENGIDAQMTDFGSGVETGQALVTGQIDLTGETQNLGVVLPATSTVKTMAAFSTAGKWWGMVGSSSINGPQDLVGKKVATQMGAQGEQWFQLYLDKHGIDPSQVTFEDIKFPQLIPALVGGDVDAIIVFQPNVEKALEAAKDTHVVAWGSDDDLAPTLGFLVGTEQLASNTELAKKVVQALRDADEWINANMDEAVDIVSKKTGITEKDMLKTIMESVTYEVALGDAERAQLQNTIDWLTLKEIVEGDINLDDLLVAGLVD